MYSDPSQIRDIAAKLNLNDEEIKLVAAAAAKAGKPVATYCREAIMKAMAELLEPKE